MADRRLQIAAVVLSLLGIAVAGYLTYVHYAGIEPVCQLSGGCEKVQTSEWADIAGIPVALLGLIGYVAILLSLLFLRGDVRKFVAAALSVSGFLFSMYLQYRSVFSIEATCQWCLASAVIMTGLAIVTVWRALLIEEPAPAGT